MKLSKSSLVLTAAFTGLIGGTMTRLNAAPAAGGSSAKLSASSGVAGQLSTSSEAKKDKDKVEKHSCKGQNSCKGKGGCKSGDNGCKGKNSCKGKGGCATDTSKKSEGEEKK